MTTLASSAEDFLAMLRSRHATMMGGRQDQRPGHVKDAANRAGESLFVLPDLVPGTLRAGWARLDELDTAFGRAVFTMFQVAEVHPFRDGNGRVARVMTNAELVAAGQARIMVPTVFCDDYCPGLDRLPCSGRAERVEQAGHGPSRSCAPSAAIGDDHEGRVA